MTCGCDKGDNKKACDKNFTRAVVKSIDPERLVEFHKVVVPASLGDDIANPPLVGKYCNVLLYYEANDQVYIYSSDGIPTKITVDIEALKQQIKKVSDDLTTETSERKEEDQKIWDEIEVIEAASDVVDVVGTYAELEAYDTSKLHDKDLIKVLQDETHDDAITYYRYSTSTHAFSYVGSEGPYYTESQVDILLSGKQDTLIAGSNIQIASDGKTISATDTTYSAFTGATSLADGTSGLVPAPVAGDEGKVLKGDGTWGTAAANTIFYMNSSESGGTRHIYKNPNMTGAATSQEVFDANDRGQVILRISNSVTPEMYSDCYLQNAYKATGDYQLLFLDEKTYRSFDTTTLSADTFTYSARVLQDQLIAGTNIQINGNTISATVPQVQSATYVYYDMYDIELGSSYVSFYSDAQLSDSFTVDDIYTAYQDSPVILVGIRNSDTAACGNLVDISENSGDYALTFYIWEYEQSEFKSYRIDGLASAYDYRAEFTKTDMAGGASGGTKVFYYDYDAALAASDGDAIPLYTGYEPRMGLDPNTEIDDDGHLFEALDGVTSALLIGIYENSSTWYYIKCADIVISSAGSENYSSNIVDPYLSIIKDELPTKQIWKFAINPGTDDVSIYKSNLQPGTMVGATSLAAGTAGLVPAPTTSDTAKYLKGDGTWAALPGANNISSNDWSGLWQ